MRLKRFARMAALAFLLTGSVVSGMASPIQEKKPNISAAENDAIKKINNAKDAAAKLDAAAQFVQKFPQSTLRPEVAKHVAGNIDGVTDVPQRITLTEKYLTIFNLPAESDLVTEGLAGDYVTTGRASDAFRVGTAFLQTHPDQIDLLRILAVTATNESIKGNDSFLKQGRDYALKAIAQIEADRKPPDMDAQKWAEYKTKYLVLLHREAGVQAMRSGDNAGASANLEKAAALKSTDPIVYFFLSHIANEEYERAALKNRSMPAGAEKTADTARVEKLLDKVIDLYAQTIATADGNAQFAEASKVIRADLDKYYTYRHGSAQGVPALIDKYKKPAQ